MTALTNLVRTPRGVGMDGADGAEEEFAEEEEEESLLGESRRRLGAAWDDMRNANRGAGGGVGSRATSPTARDTGANATTYGSNGV